MSQERFSACITELARIYGVTPEDVMKHISLILEPEEYPYVNEMYSVVDIARAFYMSISQVVTILKITGIYKHTDYYDPVYTFNQVLDNFSGYYALN